MRDEPVIRFFYEKIYHLSSQPCLDTQVASHSLTWRHTPSREVTLPHMTSHSLTWRDVSLLQLTDKDKDRDWYKSMLKNFHSVEESTEKPKLPTVLKKASVYEKWVSILLTIINTWKMLHNIGLSIFMQGGLFIGRYSNQCSSVLKFNSRY